MKIKDATFITSVASADKFLKTDKPIIAVAGKSNVGKSSLINMLANQKKLAKTSVTPGRTRLINYFDFGEFVLADLPGYGYAKVSHDEKIRWSELMEAYFSTGRDIRLVVQLIDMRHAPSQQDIDMLDYMTECGIPFVVALTKADKLNKTERMNQLESICGTVAKYGNIPVVPFSATKGDGAEELRALIEKYVISK